MSYKPQNNVFITYNNPNEFKSKKNRHTVSSFASRSYRPTSKKIVLDRTLYQPLVHRKNESLPSRSVREWKKNELKREEVSPGVSGTEQTVATIRHATPLDDAALGSPMIDPFTSYPIPVQPYVPFLVDYFIRFLTPRFTPALSTETSQYLVWFNFSLHHDELFHALIALSQVYYNIDIRGFGHPHWTSLYHRGEALKRLRWKVETSKAADDDAAILTALWLMDVDAANGDFHAYAMHKRAKERMVATRGGIRRLHPELQDELLKSEFFLPLYLYGKFVCEVTHDNVLVRYREHVPVTSSSSSVIKGVFSIIAAKGLLTSCAVDILQRIFKQLAAEPQFVRAHSSTDSVCSGTPAVTSLSANEATNEMSRVLHLTDKVELKSLNHRILLALLIYIFNLHNQPYVSTAQPSTPPLSDTEDSRNIYLDILSKVAFELASPGNPEDPKSVTEREVTLWTMVAIGSTASFSPWRLEIPFMGHMIELMENDEDDICGRISIGDQGVDDPPELSDHNTGGHGGKSSSPEHMGSRKQLNLDKLTECLRGYYLYGADKATLRSLQHWDG